MIIKARKIRLRRRLPSLNALLAFDAAAQHGGFTSAARELGVAQPAVTRHISNLEKWLATELFKRNGNSVELTADGYAMAELVQPMFDRLELGLAQFASSSENQIVIGASFGMMHIWLMPQITAMRGVVKGTTINFVSSEKYDDFEHANVDLSVQFGTGNWPGKEARLIFTETTHVIASPEFLQQNPEFDEHNLVETLNPQWLLDHGDPHNYGWMTWKLWFEHHGAEMPAIPGSRDIHNYPTLLDMVRCGEGVALGYVGLDNNLVESGEIVRLGPPLRRPRLGYYLLSDKNQKGSAVIEELKDFLISLG